MRQRWNIAIASIAIALATACDSLPGTPKASDLPLAPQEVKDFAQLYADNCAGCHGANGSYGAATPLNDATYLALVDDNSLKQIIARGTPGTSMPPFAISEGGSLTDEQIAILVSGMRARWAGAATKDPSMPPYAERASGDSQAGAEVYSSHCAPCHGADGAGGARAGSIVDGSYLSLTSDQSIRTLIIAGRGDLGHPDWRSYQTPLTAQQVSDLLAWITAKRRHSTSSQTASVK